jgi:hypothetical protein
VKGVKLRSCRPVLVIIKYSLVVKTTFCSLSNIRSVVLADDAEKMVGLTAIAS